MDNKLMRHIIDNEDKLINEAYSGNEKAKYLLEYAYKNGYQTERIDEVLGSIGSAVKGVAKFAKNPIKTVGNAVGNVVDKVKSSYHGWQANRHYKKAKKYIDLYNSAKNRGMDKAKAKGYYKLAMANGGAQAMRHARYKLNADQRRDERNAGIDVSSNKSYSWNKDKVNKSFNDAGFTKAYKK